MKELKVNIPNHEYNIYIESGLLSRSGELVKEVYKGEKIAIVSDSNVASLYSKTLIESLESAGFNAKLFCIPAGEESKCSRELFRLYDELLDFGMTRTDMIIALGGGVVGDLTGYAAASLLRGIPFIQIPTTLLAQVDSSVGGKVAIDLPRGKNLVGAFYQPKMVIIDTDCLKTLSDRILSDGMAEVIKYGAILDKDLFNLLESIKNTKDLFAKIAEIVYTCCNIKRMVVEADEFDTGERMLLNFGHTFGHAIEKQYNFKTYTHGEAVGIGMIMACRWGEKNGLTPSGTADRIEAVIDQYNLPVSVKLDLQSFKAAMAVDKKGESDMINLIILKEIGKAAAFKTQKAGFVL